MTTLNTDDSALDAIEHELYDPRATMKGTEIHRVRGERELSLPTSWGGDESPIITGTHDDKGISFGAKLLLFSVLLLFVALAFTAWRVVSLRNVVSSNNIDMLADVTPFIEGGEATPLIVTIRNRNQSTLENVKVTLLYKQGSSSLDEQEKIQEKRDVGNILPDEYKKQDFSLVLYGAESESRDVMLKLEYGVTGSNALFNKTLTTTVVLKTPPISVSLDGPESLSIGQNGTYTFIVRNNSATSSLPSLLQVTLPNTFTLDSSSEKPIARTTSWGIEGLSPGEAKTISITGSLTGKEGEIATIQAKVGREGDSPKTLGIVYASQTRDIRLRASPLSITMRLVSDKGGEDAMRYNDLSRFEISYKNIGTQALEDVSIVLYLDGDAPLYKTINPTSGYYDSIAKTITWNKATFPDLAVLPPNSEGYLQIIIPTVDKGNNTPKLTARLVANGSLKSSDDVVATITKTWAIQGSATLSASTKYKNATLVNLGPIPPKANIETTYSASLKVSAQNALSSAKVSFTLPVYVSWRNVSTDSVRILYDAKTRTVTWNIGAMKESEIATAEVSLTVKPSQSHVGQAPVITSGIILEADEALSQAHLKTTLSPITTRIIGENWSGDPSLVID
jgi:hypothetical protein